MIFPGSYDRARSVIELDNATGEAVTLLPSRDALIFMQDLPRRIQFTLARLTRAKSRPLENYYWSHLIPKIQKHQGMTPPEAHRFLLDSCAPRDRFGRPITMSDGDFDLWMQMPYIETCRDFMARDMDIETMDPDPNWRKVEAQSAAG